MADEESQRVECVFKTLVNITEKSGNLRKDLRNDILESISTLRKVFSNLKTQLDITSDENKKLKVEVKKAQEAMVERRERPTARQVAPSLDNRRQTPSSHVRQLSPPAGRNRKLFTEVLKGGGDKRYKLTLKAKDNEKSPEQIKLQLKKEINPTDIKVGIKTFKTLQDGRIIIETGSEEEINPLSSAISTKCGEQLEIIKHQLRKPRIIIYNAPEDITTENVIDIIKAQNPDITPNGEDMVAKFKYKTKKGNYNIVIEVGPQTRKQILQTKLKLGWEICSSKDYLAPIRCYRCSRFNHKHNECK
jgi:regulator of replication initiation timing